ncbi:MAG TPA: glycosyltransferase family 39 protein, partial [Acidobacteriaceae bacterium]|nr:glycosyltransferase family 39 protein [Acidobacteriaceae bacterium]
ALYTAPISEETEIGRPGLRRAAHDPDARGVLTRRARVLRSFWIAAIVALYALHFPHILADFPNHSPWMDYAKYTDEGWYANAATRFTLTGHWYLPGDFNPAVALPVWPLLLGFVFRFTGVSLAAARLLGLTILGANLLLSYAVVRRHAPQWVALLAITMLAANPFLYAFSRLALLEPLLVCLMLLCWWLALRSGAQMRAAVAAAVGVLLCLMVLTKTTGLLLVPSVLFILAYACGFRLRPTLRSIGIAAGCGIALWCAWYFLLIRPHYRADYDYFFQANRWPQPVGLGGHIAAYWWALHGLLWVSPALCITAVALLAIAAMQFIRGEDGQKTRLWKNPLVLASLLAVAGYILLIGMQNHPQPRYYALAAYPLCFLLVLVTGELVRGPALLSRIVGAAGVVVIAAVCAAGAIRILGYVRHPEYTWLRAATNLGRTIRENPGPNHLLLSVSGDEVQLMTHLPAICDDYGSWSLADRIRVYQPGWYAAWNEIDDDIREELESHYTVRQVASFPAFDDKDRDVLILYRLEPLPGAGQIIGSASGK